ncbi:hypothetical protein ACPYO6_00330 [Georgenia sp. Z1344]|uniref:hypothetical protein n=1 Tax=Georgenia sp. Z1344 TaxID=3416706 RepID=UPI003CECE8CA
MGSTNGGKRPGWAARIRRHPVVVRIGVFGEVLTVLGYLLLVVALVWWLVSLTGVVGAGGALAVAVLGGVLWAVGGTLASVTGVSDS